MSLCGAPPWPTPWRTQGHRGRQAIKGMRMGTWRSKKSCVSCANQGAGCGMLSPPGGAHGGAQLSDWFTKLE